MKTQEYKYEIAKKIILKSIIWLTISIILVWGFENVGYNWMFWTSWAVMSIVIIFSKYMEILGIKRDVSK